MTTAVNDALVRLPLRAESVSAEHLRDTFVDVGALFSLLSSRDHQVLYGRRGTGKTHCLYYLSEKVKSENQVSIFVDMRTIGSTSGILADEAFPLSERGTRLLADVLGVIHAALYAHALRSSDDGVVDSGLFFEELDNFADAITEIKVVGTVEREKRQQEGSTTSARAGINLSVVPPAAAVSAAYDDEQSREIEDRHQEAGVARHSIHFGAVGQCVQRLVASLPDERLWLLIDEWSAIPAELQPILADWFRRCLFPIRGVTVKIASIERRSTFIASQESGDYVGIELGADTSAVLDLDDFLVFGNEQTRAMRFFGELLHRHAQAALAEFGVDEKLPVSVRDFLEMAFEDPAEAFKEFVRASEGVPRDAINIAGLCGQLAHESKISVTTVRRAARRWYARDKEAAITLPRARDLLHWITDKVLRETRGAVFLLEERRASSDRLIELLYDARVLHVLKKGVVASATLGERFDVYGLDYGCYVDFLASAEQPSPAPGTNGMEHVTVEEISLDEYEPSPETILNLDEFYGTRQPNGA